MSMTGIAFVFAVGFSGAAGLPQSNSPSQQAQASIPSMKDDVDPSFEVATIKPSESTAPMIQELGQKGRYFTTVNASLSDLIQFAYEVQSKQIVSGPEWLDKARYDISAVQNQEGKPSLKQVRSMLQKLLAKRFNLVIHHDKRELSAFVLSVGKNGEKLVPTQMKGPAPVNSLHSAGNGWTLSMRNASIADFAGYLQMIVLDRPVVDETHIAGRFDLAVTFTPDDSEFKRNPPPAPKDIEGEPAPNLFESIQEQLGLKIEAKKTPVDVIAIDSVTKPTEN